MKKALWLSYDTGNYRIHDGLKNSPDKTCKRYV